MLELKRGFVERAVNLALGNVRFDDLDGWHATCPPPCDVHHILADTLPDHEEGRIFVFQTRIEHPDDPTIGVIAYGRSALTAGNERGPLAARLDPRLESMAFTAILSPDIDATYAEVFHNSPPQASRVELPLMNDGKRLRANVYNLHPDKIDLATIYLM